MRRCAIPFASGVFTEVRKLGIPVVQVTHDAQDVPPAGSRITDGKTGRECGDMLR